MISLMGDVKLRVSEAAAVKWEAIEVQSDCTGRLLIRRSKMDPEGRRDRFHFLPHDEIAQGHSQLRDGLRQPYRAAPQPDFKAYQAGSTGSWSGEWL